jgi:hypothetical protein
MIKDKVPIVSQESAFYDDDSAPEMRPHEVFLQGITEEKRVRTATHSWTRVRGMKYLRAISRSTHTQATKCQPLDLVTFGLLKRNPTRLLKNDGSLVSSNGLRTK